MTQQQFANGKIDKLLTSYTAVWDQNVFVFRSFVARIHIVDFWIHTNFFASIEDL